MSAASEQSPASVALTPDTDADLRLWYERPAATWVEALPLGNGRIGAMVFGGVTNEPAIERRRSGRVARAPGTTPPRVQRWTRHAA